MNGDRQIRMCSDHKQHRYVVLMNDKAVACRLLSLTLHDTAEGTTVSLLMLVLALAMVGLDLSF
jgi:hypothetical protein